MTNTVHAGGCLCGAVRYRVAGEPLRVGLCHCETCRRNTGASFGTFAVIRREQLTLLSGETSYYQSSPEGRRHFCRACGSPVYADSSNSDEIDIYVGTLDSPERLAPTYELWTVRRAHWLPNIDGLKCFTGDRT
jgi:hypothetical protein